MIWGRGGDFESKKGDEKVVERGSWSETAFFNPQCLSLIFLQRFLLSHLLVHKVLTLSQSGSSY